MSENPLDEVRNRHYPQRCKVCFLMEDVCQCIKAAELPIPKSGVPIRNSARIFWAVYN